MKNKNHQNKINRMCIKHGNLQCFLSMSFNVFNTTLGSDTFPPSRGRPWGGGLPYIYIHIFPQVSFLTFLTVCVALKNDINTTFQDGTYLTGVFIS